MIDIKHCDCLELLKAMPDNSVDLMLQDLPYGISSIKWDKQPDLNLFWPEWLRVLKADGTLIFTATQPFASRLILSQEKIFRYDLIWCKQNKQGFLDANKRPLRAHEHILVFSKIGHPKYYPQKFKSNKLTNHKTPIKKNLKEKGIYASDASYKNRVLWQETQDRFPTSLIEFSNWNGALFGDTKNATKHPTQKPVDLFRYLILSYSQPGDLVFDGFLGSGTTAIACYLENRNFIGAEKELLYYDLSIRRVNELINKPTLKL